MKILKRITAVITVLLLAQGAMAQDYLLSQPWAVASMVSPSFAGFNLGGKAFATYRNMYSSLNGAHVAVAGYDQYGYEGLRCSRGLYVRRISVERCHDDVRGKRR